MGADASQALAVASATSDAHVFKELPYGPDGMYKEGAKLSLDLREGSWVQIANQPDWDEKRWGKTGQVMATQDSLQGGGHYAIRMGGHDSAPIRALGRWWLTAAARGEVPSIPVVPVAP